LGSLLRKVPNPIDAIERGARVLTHAADDLVDKGRDAADYVADMAVSVVPDDIRVAPKLPPYPALPAVDRARAAARGLGETSPQPVITGSDRKPHEPVSLYVTGTKEELRSALERSGWKKAHELTKTSAFRTAVSILNRVTHFRRLLDYNYQESPVSDMYLDGRKSVMAFNKHNQYDLSRDHLRVFDTGRKAPDGRPIWAIAATRDVAMHLQPRKLAGYHEIDPRIDGERDLVMADLLASGRVREWRITDGRSTPDVKRHIARKYATDGKIYAIDLTSATK